MSLPTGEDPYGDRGGPSLAKSRNGLIPAITSQRMAFCALPGTEPDGDALQSIIFQPTDDDDDGGGGRRRRWWWWWTPPLSRDLVSCCVSVMLPSTSE